MATTAAKKRAFSGTFATALAVLLAAGAAEASRFTPTAASGLAQEQGLYSLSSLPRAGDLAAALPFEPTFRFPLFIDQSHAVGDVDTDLVPTNPRPAAFRLFPGLASAPASPTPRSGKLASGLESWEPQLNVQRVQQLAAVSWWSHEKLGDLDSPNLYAYVAWQPHMATDPLGTEVSVSNSGVFVVSDVRSGRRGKISRFSRAWGQENKVGLLTILVGAGGLSQPEALRLMGEHGVQIQSNTPEALAALAIQMGAVDEFVTAATKAYVTSWAAAATGGAAGFALEAAGASSFAASSGGAFLAGVAAQGTSDLMQGELSGLDSYLTAGAVSTAGLWAFQGGASLLRSGGGQTFGLGLEPPTVTWRNGWRTPDGKFASPTGGPRPGAPAEEAVWEAVAQKPGWQVVEGRVYVTDSTGQVRVYDGAAISPSGRTIGLEVKSGTATRDLAQRTFDLRLNSNPDNAAIGIGRNRGLVVRRALQIRR